jgi:methanogenic corrinoid protein MtbC1
VVSGIAGIGDFRKALPELAAAAMEIQWSENPQLEVRYGASGRGKCEQDTQYHLSYLAEALQGVSYTLFREYIAWAKILLESLGLDSRHFKDNLKILSRTMDAHTAGELRAAAMDYLDRAAQELEFMPSTIASFITAENPLGGLASGYLEDLLAGDRRKASERILSSIAAGTGVADVYRWVFEVSQREIGRLWQMNQLSVAQEHFCTAATQMVMCQLYPQILGGQKTGGVFVGACVSGELHEIGIRMVTDFFEMAGWDTHFLGANTPAGSVLDHVQKIGAQVVGISATVTPHVELVRRFIADLRSRPALKYSAPFCQHIFQRKLGGFNLPHIHAILAKSETS